MATTSPIFKFTIATTSDTVNIVSHIAENWTTLDSILNVAHTGTGELKSGLTLTSPTLTSPTIVGTLTGGNIVGTTGSFQTITATGGSVTIDSLSVGTYSYPATNSANGLILTIVTGNALWVANAPGTGASTALDNLASVVINTSLNTFTAGALTLTSLLKVTTGTISGMTSISATTGTFSAGFSVAGTISADVINVTGGDVTIGTFAIGTYSYPLTVGAANQWIGITTANAVWKSAAPTTAFAHSYCKTNTEVAANVAINVNLDSSYSLGITTVSGTALTVLASGHYQINIAAKVVPSTFNTGGACFLSVIHSGAKTYSLGTINAAVTGSNYMGGGVLLPLAAGDKLLLSASATAVAFDVKSGTANTFMTVQKVADDLV